MEFYKSSTGSGDSKSSRRRSDKSNSSYMALDFCTTTSSTAPCINSSQTPQAVMAVGIDKIIKVPSNESLKRSSSENISKRKRKLSNSNIKDSEIAFEPPLAKRQQRLPSIYQSELDSVVSSVYPSPVDDVNGNDTRSSFDCLSTATEFDVVSDGILDSPNSLQTEDDGVSSPSVSSSGSYNNPHLYIVHAAQNSDHRYDGTKTPGGGRKDISPIVTNTNTAAITRVKPFDDCLSAHHCMTPAAELDPPRMCPLPALSWANAQDVWQLMCLKDGEAAGLRDAVMLDQHPGLQPRMRAILLDWLIEVCEVYKLHRETYYLAVDYLDRYLTTRKKVQKTHLQLIGITCLFIASKVEEIYPPKIGEFAYVTDGACHEQDILQHEILLLQALNWSISPVTVMGWLGVYMQLNVNNRTPASINTASINTASKRTGRKKQHSAAPTSREKYCVSQNAAQSDSATFSEKVSNVPDVETKVDEAFIYPQFSGMEFVQTAQLLDLCSLDVSIGSYPYSVLAAAAISHTFNREIAIRCSGLEWTSIQDCARWMEPFFQVICEESEHLRLIEQHEEVPSKFGMGYVCPNIVSDDSHIIQTHTTTMAMFDRACLLQEQQTHRNKYLITKNKAEASPATDIVCVEGLLTPPASSRKPLDIAEKSCCK